MICDFLVMTDYLFKDWNRSYLFILNPIYKNINNCRFSNLSSGSFSVSYLLSDEIKLGPDGLTPLPA